MLKKKNNHCILLLSASRPTGAQKSLALSSFVGLQPDSPLTGNLSSRWGHPGLVPPEARDPAARRASQRALGRAGLVRAGTQGDMRGGRAGPGAPSGWSQPSLPRPACHPGGTAPRHDVSAGCSPTGRVLRPFQAPFQDVFRVSTSCQNPLKSSLTGAALPLPSVLLPPGFRSARSQENNFCQCKLPFFGGSRVID